MSALHYDYTTRRVSVDFCQTLSDVHFVDEAGSASSEFLADPPTPVAYTLLDDPLVWWLVGVFAVFCAYLIVRLL